MNLRDLRYLVALADLRTRQYEMQAQALAMRVSTAEMGPAVFDGWLPLWYIEIVSAHLDACLRYVRGLPGGLKRICLSVLVLACPPTWATT